MKTAKEYLEASTECPQCGGLYVELLDSPWIKGDEAFCSCRCADCELKWVDKFKLVGYEVTE